MMKYGLQCSGCHLDYGPDYPCQTCGKCGKNLEVIYKEKPKFKKSGGRDFWDYESLLPNARYNHSELGGTRLIQSHEGDNIYLKLELENPTRSFKDRGSIIEITKAKEYGYDRITCASTGNMAYSLCYYANLEGMKANVFISNAANIDKIRKIRAVGDADIFKVDGDFNRAMDLAYKYSKKSNSFLTGDYPYRKEGQKILAYEIMDQLPSATHLIVPVGNATLLSGISKALKELKAAGKLRRLPKIVAVQAEGCSPFIKSLNQNKELKHEIPRTKADAIAVGYPTYGKEGLEAVRKTHGCGISVTEAEMLKEQKAFKKEHGLVAELGGIASLAAVRKLKLKDADKAVAIISGGNV